MKVSCLQENLSRGLAIVGRAVASRATPPTTQSVLVSTEPALHSGSAHTLRIRVTASAV